MSYTLAEFGPLDWLVIAGYMAIMVVIGLRASRGQKDEETYFLGGRNIPTWAASLSVLATALSAATFIGVPQNAFNNDVSYLILNIGGIIAAFLVAYMLIPAFYKAGTVTIYGYLGQRMGTGAKIAASITFFLGRLLSSGSRFFMVGLPFALLIFGEKFIDPSYESMSFFERLIHQDSYLIITLIILGIIGVVYVAFGGITAVIWTDVIQFFVMTGAVVVAIGIIWFSLPKDVNIWEELTKAKQFENAKVVVDDSGNAVLNEDGDEIITATPVLKGDEQVTKNKLNFWDWGYAIPKEETTKADIDTIAAKATAIDGGIKAELEGGKAVKATIADGAIDLAVENTTPPQQGVIARFFSGFEYWKAFTFMAALASILGTMASYGVDQDMVQRTMTTRSAKKSSWSMISAILLSIPVVLLFVIVGLMLSLYYARPDIMNPASVISEDNSKYVFPIFLKNEMPTIIAGAAVAGLLAAAMSTYDSAVNSMSSTAVTDIIAPICKANGKTLSSKEMLKYSRFMVMVVGVLLTAFGILSIYLARTFEDLLSFALGVMSYPYAGLLGVFLVAILTKKRGNSYSAIAAMVVGALLVLTMNNFLAVRYFVESLFVADIAEKEVWLVGKHAIAWPFWMLIATPITFTICLLGKSPEKEAEASDAYELKTEAVTTATE
ncbi:sodium:solute symporter family transporter [Poriferisphaera sp. WC338]|uniref:sodium:solute symporter family transporter n=1 Tax=Poriferisphaera sp. WC338 TaxID=3425129 RepID=UPI003D819F0B